MSVTFRTCFFSPFPKLMMKKLQDTSIKINKTQLMTIVLLNPMTNKTVN